MKKFLSQNQNQNSQNNIYKDLIFINKNNIISIKRKQHTTTMSNKSKSVSSVSHTSSCKDLNVGFNADAHQWTKMPEYNGAKRSRHTVVAYEDYLYAFGGHNGVKITNDFVKFSVKDKSWTRVVSKGTKPEPRILHSAVVLGDSMFIFGGNTGKACESDLFEYNFKSSQWIKFKTSQGPGRRSSHGAAIYDNKMWIYGGYDGSDLLNDMWTINLTGKKHKWEKVEQKGEGPSKCSLFPVAVARDSMFVCLGYKDTKQIRNCLFEFNFKTKTWCRTGNEHVLQDVALQPPSRKYGHSMVHHDHFLYIFGGLGNTDLPTDLHCYDLDSQEWSVIQSEAKSDIPSGRIFHASAVISDAMYIFGGEVRIGVECGDTYKLQFSSHPKCTLREDYGKFFHEQQFCDIEFIVGSEEVKIMAHIAFVAARSKYLETKILTARNARQQQMQKIFSSGCIEVKETLLEVRLPNANPEAFELILNYIYTDKIVFKESSTKNIIILITDIYQLADTFLMPRLAQSCLQYLDVKINKRNVLEALYYADKKKIQIIKDHCIHFLIKQENFNNLVKSSEFSALDKPLLAEIKLKKLNFINKVTDNNLDKNIGTTLENDMAAFLEFTGNDFSDISFVLEDQVIKAHKSILMARAPYFQAMFRSFVPPDNKVNISIDEISPSVEAVQSLLRYIYYGETKLPPQDALYLLQASDFYIFSNDRLSSLCEYSIEHNITYENVLETLEASHYTKIFDIKDYALKLIVKDFARVARLPKISSLSPELLLEIKRAVADSNLEFLTSIGINADV